MKIEVKNLTKEFKKTSILNEVSITFESGKIYGLIGKNGSGKSVFLKLLCSLYEPTSGEVLYDGIDIFKNHTFPENTRALIESPSFIDDLTGYENLEMLASIQNKIGKKEIEESLKKVNLYDEKDKKYNKYSLGMKQKLGIAQVLMEDPKIMILDEPFNGIEEDTTQKLRTILKAESRKDKIIILATHIKDDVDNLADIVYKFDAGKIKKYDK